MNTFTLIFLLAIVVGAAVRGWLASRHVHCIRKHRESVPDAFHDAITLDEHRKAADYTVAQTRFDRYESFYSDGWLLVWTLGGGLQAVDSLWRSFGWSPIATGVGFLLTALTCMTVLDAVPDAYRTFVIEEKFGFNRMSPRLFLADLIKHAALLLVIGAPLSALALWLMQHTGAQWWLFVWAAWIGFSILMLWAYPTFIAPLFNKFSPLTNGDLRMRIESLLSRNGFFSQGIFVMDGSARSAHGNAYFTGFGSNKRIVFFDTLISELTHEEIEAVLAHELGHFKCKHVIKQMALMAVLSLAALAVLGWLSAEPAFYSGLGVDTPSPHAALMLFLLALPSFSFIVKPILTGISRTYEFEADAFASAQANGRALVQALVKLYQENASTLTPDAWYSAFYDSHPPAPVRIARLHQLTGSISR
jgi:STE24 endopeptidase